MSIVQYLKIVFQKDSMLRKCMLDHDIFFILKNLIYPYKQFPLIETERARVWKESLISGKITKWLL